MESPFFLIALFAILAIEFLLSRAFNKFYFEFGLPLFATSAKVGKDFKLPVTAGEIEHAVSGASSPDFAFAELDDSRFAFREVLFGVGLFSYTPVMHGVLSYDAQARQINVKGRANWFPIFFIGLFFYSLDIGGADAWFALPLAAVLGFIYVIQAVRFSRIASTVARWKPPSGSEKTLNAS